MEKFGNKKTLLLASAVGLAALGLGWYLKSGKSCCSKFKFIKDPKFEENVALYRKEASMRAKYISNTKYKVTLALRKGETCDGHTLVTFNLNELPAEDLWLDFAGFGVGYVKINGNDVPVKDSFNGHRVLLAASKLVKG